MTFVKIYAPNGRVVALNITEDQASALIAALCADMAHDLGFDVDCVEARLDEHGIYRVVPYEGTTQQERR